MAKKGRRRVGVDLDGVLCVGEYWKTPEQALRAKPIKKMIDYINKTYYRTDFVIIYTARQNWLMSSTYEWLDNNGVKYHAVMNKKCPLEIMIDDIAIFPKI